MGVFAHMWLKQPGVRVSQITGCIAKWDGQLDRARGGGLTKWVRLTQKENTRQTGMRALRRRGLGRRRERRREGGLGWVGGSIKKSHAFVIFISIFRFVSLFSLFFFSPLKEPHEYGWVCQRDGTVPLLRLNKHFYLPAFTWPYTANIPPAGACRPLARSDAFKNSFRSFFFFFFYASEPAFLQFCLLYISAS